MSQKWGLKGDLGFSKLGDGEILLKFESKRSKKVWHFQSRSKVVVAQ